MEQLCGGVKVNKRQQNQSQSGENDLETNHYDLNVNVLQQNSPYIQGSSVPDNFYFKYENIKDKEISHIFKIGNGGPSPLKLEVFILLPMMDKDGVDIFVAQANGLLNGIQIQCYPVKNTAMHSNDADNRLTESLNKTVLINCFQRDMECLQLFCDGGYLHKSTELADFHVKITVKTDLLGRIEGHAATQIFTSSEKPIPIWIYIVGSLIGLLLLGLLIFLLYKPQLNSLAVVQQRLDRYAAESFGSTQSIQLCVTFFERNYRDKLNDEKLMESDIEQDTHTLEENTNQSSEITEDS
ncbi:hypothetical protein NQ317_008430 [Molorchus minor]|uniref:Integrin alpha-2 domain-containing protein n=1 Tax=Molorchus minor TaxID=1323400 RepID=A0ABQ9IVB9_9CUCU|nr:hypothetical protein NQ317_008430 [Molorchus minor]